MDDFLTSESQPILQELGPLTGLPGDARFVPVVGKSPTQEKWNSDPTLWLTAEQALKTRALGEGRWTGIGLLTGRKVGRLCWLDFDGEETDPVTGQMVRSASLDFEYLFLKPVTALPPCPVSISGRPGRCRMLFRVPLEWSEYFAGFSITGTETPTKSLEFLYEKAGDKLFHAVVEGQHPDGQGWFYRWQEGASPADVAIPDLPAWVIAGLVRHMAEKYRVREERTTTERSDGEYGPMDLLSPGKQRKVLKEMQKFWPFRGGAAGTGYAGDYAVMRRLVLSLWKGIGDEGTFRYWLVGSDWDMRNDWAGDNGSAAVNGGELLSWVKSLAKSDTAEEVKPWATAWELAKANGWCAPAWALPPRELNVEDFTMAAAKKVVRLREAIQLIDAMDSPTDRLASMQELTKMLGIKEAEMGLLVRTLQEEDGTKEFTSGTLEELLANAKPIKPCIDGLLASGAVTMVASEGGVGKSVLIYRLAEAVALGAKFGGELQAVKGNVLVVQKDESQANAAQKMKLMQLRNTEGRIRFQFNFHAGMYPELRKWIREHESKLVVMDSFGAIFGGSGTGLSDAEAGLHLYRLNQIASEEDCAIVLTHHLRKMDKTRKGARSDVSLGDLFGSSYIVNGASDVWAVVKEQAEAPHQQLEPKFVLKVLKPRTGITQAGDRIALKGSMEDLSFTIETFNEDKDRSKNHKALLQKVVTALSKQSAAGGLQVSELSAVVNSSVSNVSRLVRGMFSDDYPGLKRAPVETGEKGRRAYRYWIE